MRIKDLKRKEVAFQVAKKQYFKKNKLSSSSSTDEISNEEMTNFVNNFPRDVCIFKGKLPLKCFNSEKIVHVAKCSLRGDRNKTSQRSNNSKRRYTMK